MTPAEFADILTGLAAVGTLILGVVQLRTIRQVRHLTNSMKDELVSEVRVASLAKGKKDEQDRQTIREMG